MSAFNTIKTYQTSDNTIITSPKEIEKTISQQFTQLYVPYNGTINKIPAIIKSILDQTRKTIGKIIPHPEICEAIHQMKPNSALGPDLLQACIDQTDPPSFASLLLPSKKYKRPRLRWKNSPVQ
eukprot:TRINITY_DN3351_c0_g1_i11.p1 TRINITY_DN3351_c0_g1~~TRINITY_DN3351_c0_g1_i11.p1  ORF type:complete len:124 (-),score=24.96 TRINITY_DN3351_c0_g1_i11:190-561(-)